MQKKFVEHALVEAVKLKKLAAKHCADPKFIKKLDSIVAQKAREALENGRKKYAKENK